VAHLHDLKEMAEAAQNRVNELKKELKKLEVDPKLLKAIEELQEKLQLQANTFGMTETEVERYKLAIQGATDAQLAQIDSLIQERKTKEENKKLADAIDSTNKSLEEQIAVFGKTSREAEIMKLSLKGATDAQLAAARAASAQLDKLDKHKELMDKGKELAKQFATPTEKIAEAQKSLSELYNEGAISLDIYNKAMIDATKSMKEMSLASRDAVLAGSLEARARFAEYKDLLAGGPRPLAPLPKVFTPAAATSPAITQDTVQKNDAHNKVVQELLKGIKDNTKPKPGVKVEAVDFSGV
jgi:DNA-binding CsgD family transcriptional regulator